MARRKTVAVKGYTVYRKLKGRKSRKRVRIPSYKRSKPRR